MKLSNTQRSILELLSHGGRIRHPHNTLRVYIHPPTSAEHDLDYREFARLIERNYIQSIAQNSTDTFYSITPTGKTLLEEKP